MFGLQSLSTLVVCAVNLICTTHALPSPNTATASPEKRQQNGPFTITGAQTGSIQPRRDIRDLQTQYPDQFNVLVLGLARMQAVNQSELLSYFQLAGIHGVPSIDWNGVTGSSQKQGPGYCTHVSNLFLPWHRPYLALYEQVLVSFAQQAAQEFPSRQQQDQYTTAASQLRLPYMDWAVDPPAGDNAFPNILTQPQIQVVTPTGNANIDNPLFSYKFHPIDPALYYQPYIYWPETLRWPTSTQADAQTQTDKLIAQMNSNQAQVKQRLYNLFTSNSNFTEIGTSAWIPDSGPGSYDSFESIHDQIHGTIGGSNYGDMSVVPVSAFDPAFWLHHAMIDRSFALWQALYPDSYVEPMAQKQGAYWYNSGDNLDAETPLKPFYASPDGTFWTASSARSISSFGYTYPELVNADQSSIRSSINKLYGSGSSTSNKRRSSKSLHSRQSGEILPKITGLVTGMTDALLSPRLYQINFRAPKNTMDKSFFIDFFLGKPLSEDPTSWLSDINLIGSQAIMSMDRPGQGDVTITGVLPLNSKLQDLVLVGGLANLLEATVVALLQDKITWRVRSSDYSAIPVERIPNFQVSVSSIEIQLPKSGSEFPQYPGGWKVYPDATSGKPGGLKNPADI